MKIASLRRSASVFKVTSIDVTSVTHVGVVTAKRRQYSLLYTDSIATGVWQVASAASNVAGTGGFLQLMDTNGVAARYYEVTVDLDGE